MGWRTRKKGTPNQVGTRFPVEPFHFHVRYETGPVEIQKVVRPESPVKEEYVFSEKKILSDFIKFWNKLMIYEGEWYGFKSGVWSVGDLYFISYSEEKDITIGCQDIILDHDLSDEDAEFAREGIDRIVSKDYDAHNSCHKWQRKDGRIIFTIENPDWAR